MSNKNYLTEARKRAGKTQDAVAAELGITQSTYSNKEFRLDFTTAQWKIINKFLGGNILTEAKESSGSVVSEPEPKYGKAGADYRQQLTLLNDLLRYEKAGIVANAEILAAIKNISPTQALRELKQRIKEKTGEDISI